MATDSSNKEVPEDPESPKESSPTSPVTPIPMTPQGQPQRPPSPLVKNCRKNPCPCCELRRGVFYIAYYTIVINTFGMIVTGLIYGLTDINRMGVTIIFMLNGFTGIISAIILAIGAAKKMRKMVLFAFAYYIAGFISHLVGEAYIIKYVAEEETDKTVRTWSIVGFATWMIIFLPVQAYMTCVISVYTDQLMVPAIGPRPNPTPQESGTQSEGSNVVNSQSPMGQGQEHPKVPEVTGQKE